MNSKSQLFKTTLVGLAVVTLGLATGRNVEAKTLDNTIESQSETQLVALKFRKSKKFKKIHHSPKRFKKIKKFHHGHHKFHGHKKFFGQHKFYKSHTFR